MLDALLSLPDSPLVGFVVAVVVIVVAFIVNVLLWKQIGKIQHKITVGGLRTLLVLISSVAVVAQLLVLQFVFGTLGGSFLQRDYRDYQSRYQSAGNTISCLEKISEKWQQELATGVDRNQPIAVAAGCTGSARDAIWKGSPRYVEESFPARELCNISTRYASQYIVRFTRSPAESLYGRMARFSPWATGRSVTKKGIQNHLEMAQRYCCHPDVDTRTNRTNCFPVSVSCQLRHASLRRRFSAEFASPWDLRPNRSIWSPVSWLDGGTTQPRATGGRLAPW